MFGQRHQAGNARLGGQQVIKIVVKHGSRRIVADAEQLPLLVKQKTELHFVKVACRLLVDFLQTVQQVNAHGARSVQPFLQFLAPGVRSRQLLCSTLSLPRCPRLPAKRGL